MVKFASLAVAIMAAISSPSAAAPPPFTKPCSFPCDVCGYTLTQDYGYQPSVLEDAATAAGQTVPEHDKSIIYDAIYNCKADGVIGWNRYCGSGHCRPATEVPNADCRL
ncbi:hypothetical protein GE09DRAFT_1228888 [Coniochaeta sp. 2T2.1]|nr:hypothetical protein GE09DRAFT_1228888 [Coniochaeta sp. 2T2.1]